MLVNQTVEEMETDLGEKLKRLRLNKNLDQKTVAARAGVSVRALRNLEGGAGTTVKTLLSVVRALGRENWLDTVAPVATINPLTLTSRSAQRQRASIRSTVSRNLPAKAFRTSTAKHAATQAHVQNNPKALPETPYVE